MTEPIVGATAYKTELDNIRKELAISIEALLTLTNDESLTRTQYALLVQISNAHSKMLLSVTALEKFGERVKDIDRAIQTGNLKL